MKTKIILISAFALAIIFNSCGNNNKNDAEKRDSLENKMDQVSDKAEAVGDTLQDDYDRYRAELNARIEQNEKDINEAWARESKKGTNARKDYKNRVEKLEKQNKEMKSRLEKQKRDEKWQEFKREFNHDMDELGKAIKDLGVNNEK